MSKHVDSLIIIIPCFNEQERLKFSEIETLQYQLGCNVLFVDDGSRDDTRDLLDTFCSNREHFNYLSLSRNAGKAKAIHAGIKVALNDGYALLGTYDADSAVSVNDYVKAKALMLENPQVDLVSGARVLLAGSGVTRTKHRRWFGRIIATYINFVIGQDFYDPQSPCKLFRKSLIANLSSPRTRWFLDIEFILSKNRTNFTAENSNTKILEFPLQEWKDVENSKITPGQFLKIMKDLLILGSQRISLKH